MNSENSENLIAEIREIQDELEKLGVRRERVNFKRMSDEDLEEFLESIGEQLRTRKKFYMEL